MKFSCATSYLTPVDMRKKNLVYVRGSRIHLEAILTLGYLFTYLESNLLNLEHFFLIRLAFEMQIKVLAKSNLKTKTFTCHTCLDFFFFFWKERRNLHKIRFVWLSSLNFKYEIIRCSRPILCTSNKRLILLFFFTCRNACGNRHLGGSGQIYFWWRIQVHLQSVIKYW